MLWRLILLQVRLCVECPGFVGHALSSLRGEDTQVVIARVTSCDVSGIVMGECLRAKLVKMTRLVHTCTLDRICAYVRIHLCKYNVSLFGDYCGSSDTFFSVRTRFWIDVGVCAYLRV